MPYALDQTIGKDCKLYYDSADNYTTPTWAELERVGDVSLNLGKNQGTSRTRERDVETAGGGTKTVVLTFTYNAKVGTDADYAALQDSYLNNTIKEFLVLDGDSGTSGSKGYRLMGIVSQLNESQAYDDPTTVDVEIIPARVNDGGTIRDFASYTVP